MVKDYDNILVPVDGSETAERAFDEAVRIVLDDNTHSDVLNIIGTRQFMGEMQDTLISGNTIYQMTQDSEKYLKSLKEWAKERFDFTDVSYHTRYSSPKRIIAVDFIKDRHNDLIVMGTTDMNAIERTSMGGVTAYTNQHALSDVLTTKTDIDNKKVAGPKKKLF